MTTGRKAHTCRLQGQHEVHTASSFCCMPDDTKGLRACLGAGARLGAGEAASGGGIAAAIDGVRKEGTYLPSQNQH